MGYLDPITGIAGTMKPQPKPKPQSGAGALLGGSFQSSILQPPSSPFLGGSFPSPFLNPTPSASIAAGTPSLAAPSVPDFTSILNNDPLYAQTRQDIAAAHGVDLNQRNSQWQRGLVNFGDVPDLDAAAKTLGLTDLPSAVSDTTRQLAQSNTAAGLSTKARIQRAHDDAVKATSDSLTARGLLSSGETGYQLNRQNESFNAANADAYQQLLDFLAQVQGGYSQSEQARLQQLMQAASEAAGRIPQTTAPTPDTPGGGGPGGPGGGGGNGGGIGSLPPSLADALVAAANGSTPPTAPAASVFAGIGGGNGGGGGGLIPSPILGQLASDAKQAPPKKPANAAGSASVGNKIKGKNL